MNQITLTPSQLSLLREECGVTSPLNPDIHVLEKHQLIEKELTRSGLIVWNWTDAGRIAAQG